MITVWHLSFPLLERHGGILCLKKAGGEVWRVCDVTVLGRMMPPLLY